MTDRAQLDWHQLDIDGALARLETTRDGISEGEARRRLVRVGPNELAVEERALPLLILLRQVQNPLIYVLLAAGAVTALLGKYVDTSVILAVVVLNSVVGFAQEYKAEQAMRALARIVAPRARVLRDGEEREIDASEIVPGDVVVVDSGAKVPADIRLLRVVDLQADESNLTGESLPVAKKTLPIPDPDAPLGDRVNLAFMGTNIVRGRGAGVVVATGMRTVFGRISAEVRRVGEAQSPLQARLDHFARLIAYIVIGVTALVFALGLLTRESLVNMFLTAVATAVAAVPEGLPVVITVALAIGVWRMARRHAIIRKLPAVETLGSCTMICSDKTGTLTKNEMTVTKVVAGGQVFEITGTGYAPEGDIILDGRPTKGDEHSALALAFRVGLLCNESSLYQENGQHRVDGDPTEGALIVAAMKAGLRKEHEEDIYPLLDEIPFESDRQYMATLHSLDGERVIFVKGAPERVLGMCEAVYVGERQAASGSRVAGHFGSTTAFDSEEALRQSHMLAAAGLRVLAMAYRSGQAGRDAIDHGDVEAGLTFVGLQGMIDPPRPEAVPAVANCRRAGIRVAMITGDHKVTAEAIARQLGIVENGHHEIVDGRELERMTDEELFRTVERASVYARAAPQHKLRVIQQLRRHGEIVAVTGDGVNDAPALKQADVGVAMGIVGTDVAKEAADIVLSDDNFATIYAAVEEGRVVFDNIRKVIMFLIPTGLGLVLTVIASVALRLPLPFLPAQAIWINLVTNGLQDVAMAFEPAEHDIGRRPPRHQREGLLTRLMVERAVVVGVVLLAGTLAAFIWQLRSGADLDHARTVAMTTMVLFQNFHIFNSQSLAKSAFRINPLSNRFLFISKVAALGLHVLALYWGPLQLVLRTRPLSLETWFAIVLIAATVLLAVEADKAARSRSQALRKRREP